MGFYKTNKETVTSTTGGRRKISYQANNQTIKKKKRWREGDVVGEGGALLELKRKEIAVKKVEKKMIHKEKSEARDVFKLGMGGQKVKSSRYYGGLVTIYYLFIITQLLLLSH